VLSGQPGEVTGRRLARTAPNHFRPAACVVDADIDAEDQPAALHPQKGHWVWLTALVIAMRRARNSLANWFTELG
jgi:hypothetical protein